MRAAPESSSEYLSSAAGLPKARGTETPPHSQIAKVAAAYSGPGPTIRPTRAPLSSSPSAPALSCITFPVR
eukprot:scaffold1182_cov396-Prasinococcus_capsulatus_cf.AAC.21